MTLGQVEEGANVQRTCLSPSLGSLCLDFGFWVLLRNGSWSIWLTAGCPSVYSPLLSTVTGLRWLHGHPKVTFSLQLSGHMTRFLPWAYEHKLKVPLPDVFCKTIRYTLLVLRFLLSQKWQVEVEKKDHRSCVCPSFFYHKGVIYLFKSFLTIGNSHALACGHQEPFQAPSVFEDMPTVDTLVGNRLHFPLKKPQRPVTSYERPELRPTDTPAVSEVGDLEKQGQSNTAGEMQNNYTAVKRVLVQNTKQDWEIK